MVHGIRGGAILGDGRAIGVLLTGMGDDRARGAAKENVPLHDVAGRLVTLFERAGAGGPIARRA